MDDTDPARIWRARLWPAPGPVTRPLWERVELVIRAAAVASLSEAEFVRRLRAAGLAVRPDSSGAAERFVVEAPPGSGEIRADAEVAADLALTLLREQWDRGPGAVGEARRQWEDLRAPSVFDRDRVVLSHPVIWSRMIGDAIEFTHELRAATACAVPWWGWAAGRVAGAFAAWALRAERGLDGAFTATVASLRESAAAVDAGADAVVARRRRSGPDLGRVAFGVTHLCAGVDDPGRSLLLLIQLSACVFELSKAHRRCGETRAARALEACAADLSAVCERLHARTVTGPADSHDSS